MSWPEVWSVTVTLPFLPLATPPGIDVANLSPEAGCEDRAGTVW